MTVRRKILLFVGLLLVIGISHAIVNQLYMNYLFDKFRNEEIGTSSYLNASPGEQIEIFKTFFTSRMKGFGIGNGILFIVIGLFFSLWTSGVLTLPLRKLGAAIERVKQGDRDVEVPVEANDEYGKVSQTFNEMTIRLREAEDARRRLVADVAHELRTPLAIMQLKLENSQHSGQQITPEMLLRLHDEVIRLNLLVEDLHVLSLAEAGRLSLDLIPLDLGIHLERIVEDVKFEAEENGLEIHLASASRPMIIPADARRIAQVFINLLTNAIRYTPAGGKISVAIEEQVIDRSSNYATVSITDTGIGIPAEDLAHLFDRFYRVEEARSRHSGGTGLGLSIAHQFVKAHGGYIRVQSMPNEGTTFLVYLPLG